MPTNFKIQITADSAFNLPEINHLVAGNHFDYIEEKYIFTGKMQQTTDPVMPLELTAENIGSFTTSAYTMTRSFLNEEDFNEYFRDPEVVGAHRDIRDLAVSAGLNYQEIID